jgi:hypothetical protein
MPLIALAFAAISSIHLLHERQARGAGSHHNLKPREFDLDLSIAAPMRPDMKYANGARGVSDICRSCPTLCLSHEN